MKKVPTILIVDDIEFVRKSIRSILTGKGYTVLEAVNGMEAVKIVKDAKVDLLITDVVMPVKGGIETLLEYKQELENVKKIIITGEVSKNTDAFVNLASALGVKNILYKPFEKEELLASVKSLIGEASR
jgi:YesN/AraC family two-component response regulator